MGLANINDISYIRIGLASTEEIRSWSHGEVKRPETINYRQLKPETDGLFCEKIFGPTKDFECRCGKYKKPRFKGITCDKCGVEVTLSKVRRERMGHIELAAPVAHIWFFKTVPSKMAYLLDLSSRDIEKVIYFASHIVLSVDEERRALDLPKLRQELEREILKLDDISVHEAEEIQKDIDSRVHEIESRMAVVSDRKEVTKLRQELKKLEREERRRLTELKERIERQKRRLREVFETFEQLKPKQVIDNYEIYRELVDLYGDYFSAGIGAEALKVLLSELDLEAEARELRDALRDARGQKRKKIETRLKIVEAFLKSGNKPEWMILEVLPVLPPELRPMVQLDGGRFASSDLNDLYRRVINRNNRLKKLLELGAPEIMVNNEKRMLQEAVDALIDNSRRAKPVQGTNGRPLKSLSDILKGKQGRFRQNLLGKRVDYSGRSVIVVGPELQLHQCGLPKLMALELFKPYVKRRLVELGKAQNIKSAEKKIERQMPEVWDVLEEVIRDKAVLLNRAPTLHRLSIQAFEPKLIEGKAIQLHPLVCPPFNADFDGDQMAVHLPLSAEAQAEARILMLSTNNILSPAHGKAVLTPSQDMALGIYWLTADSEDPDNEKGAGMRFASPEEALIAFESGAISARAPIEVRMRERGVNGRIQTTVGRIIFNRALPEDFEFINQELTKKDVGALVEKFIRRYSNARTAAILDSLKEIGFKYATKPGITIGIEDMMVAATKAKAEIIQETMRDQARIEQQYAMGLITEEEREEEVYHLFIRAMDRVADAIMENFAKFNPINAMATSGARGSVKQIQQLCGMRGWVQNSRGETIKYLITSNFLEGLPMLDYFISTHGARKGLVDTALKTARAGYLTRRIVDACQDVIVREEDCGTPNGRPVAVCNEEFEFSRAIIGRVVLGDIEDPATGEIIAVAGDILDEEKAERVYQTRVNMLRELDEERKQLEKQVESYVYDDRGKPEGKRTLPGAALDVFDMIKGIIREKDTASTLVLDSARLGDAIEVFKGHKEAYEAVKRMLELSDHFLETKYIYVRTPLSCRTKNGVCQKCYGWSLADRRLVEIGEAVGIIAAQSLGEPGTQLTMRTFHVGGIAGTDITHGLPRVEQLLSSKYEVRQLAMAFDGTLELMRITANAPSAVARGRRSALAARVTIGKTPYEMARYLAVTDTPLERLIVGLLLQEWGTKVLASKFGADLGGERKARFNPWATYLEQALTPELVAGLRGELPVAAAGLEAKEIVRLLTERHLPRFIERNFADLTDGLIELFLDRNRAEIAYLLEKDSTVASADQTKPTETFAAFLEGALDRALALVAGRAQHKQYADLPSFRHRIEASVLRNAIWFIDTPATHLLALLGPEDRRAIANELTRAVIEARDPDVDAILARVSAKYDEFLAHHRISSVVTRLDEPSRRAVFERLSDEERAGILAGLPQRLTPDVLSRLTKARTALGAALASDTEPLHSFLGLDAEQRYAALRACDPEGSFRKSLFVALTVGSERHLEALDERAKEALVEALAQQQEGSEQEESVLAASVAAHLRTLSRSDLEAVWEKLPASEKEAIERQLVAFLDEATIESLSKSLVDRLASALALQEFAAYEPEKKQAKLEECDPDGRIRTDLVIEISGKLKSLPQFRDLFDERGDEFKKAVLNIALTRFINGTHSALVREVVHQLTETAINRTSEVFAWRLSERKAQSMLRELIDEAAPAAETDALASMNGFLSAIASLPREPREGSLDEIVPARFLASIWDHGGRSYGERGAGMVGMREIFRDIAVETVSRHAERAIATVYESEMNNALKHTGMAAEASAALASRFADEAVRSLGSWLRATLRDEFTTRLVDALPAVDVEAREALEVVCGTAGSAKKTSRKSSTATLEKLVNGFVREIVGDDSERFGLTKEAIDTFTSRRQPPIIDLVFVDGTDRHVHEERFDLYQADLSLLYSIFRSAKSSVLHLQSGTALVRLKVGADVKISEELGKKKSEAEARRKLHQLRLKVLEDVLKIYESQGAEIDQRHLEIIAKQMTRRVEVTEQGDSDFLPGTYVDERAIEEANRELIKQGKRPAKWVPTALDIRKAALESDSFLSAASFLETTRVLANAAVEGKVDYLLGLKENVIIGKLIPAGTGSPAHARFEPEFTVEEPEVIEREGLRQMAREILSTPGLEEASDDVVEEIERQLKALKARDILDSGGEADEAESDEGEIMEAGAGEEETGEAVADNAAAGDAASAGAEEELAVDECETSVGTEAPEAVTEHEGSSRAEGAARKVGAKQKATADVDPESDAEGETVAAYAADNVGEGEQKPKKRARKKE